MVRRLLAMVAPTPIEPPNLSEKGCQLTTKFGD